MRKNLMFQTVLLSLAAVAALSAQPVFTTIHTFAGAPNDGANGNSTLTLGPGGILYGATAHGGTFSSGVIFSMTPPATTGGAWTETVLYSFGTNGIHDGYAPNGVLIGAGGALYGTTVLGGDSEQGTVFALAPPAAAGGEWTETILHSFSGNDGGEPFFPLSMDSRGVLYGVAQQGAANQGTVFSMTPPSSVGGSWTFTQLYSFAGGATGENPMGAVIPGPNGELYGVTQNGGSIEDKSCNQEANIGCGMVYELTAGAPGASWNMTALYNFTGESDGRFPFDIVMAPGGVLYGSVDSKIFSLTPPASPGGSWTETVIAEFPAYVYQPYGLVATAGGRIYGVTGTGGDNGGTVFSLSPSGNAWTKNILYSFPVNGGGYQPEGVTIAKADGSIILYGTTYLGPPDGPEDGIVYSLIP